LILESLPCRRASWDHNHLSTFSEGTGCLTFIRCTTAMQKENINELKAKAKNDKWTRQRDSRCPLSILLSLDQV
jgi:hypothetical protein